MFSSQRTEFYSSFEVDEPQPRAKGTADLHVEVGAGPSRSPTAKTGVGYTGHRALRYRGDAPGKARVRLFAIDLVVSETMELSYVVFPDSDDEPRFRSTFVGLDVEFADGSTLSGLGAVDQHGVGVAAREQGRSNTAYLDQWNSRRCRLRGVAAGKRARAIVLTTDVKDAAGACTGWIDDVRLGEPLCRDEPRAAADYVRTTRGTHSSREFSRGNTFPATAVPHGFNFWTPITNAASTRWLYEYHRANNADNLPRLEAFALSHQPSPWVGDRQSFQLMPGIGAITGDRRARARTFRHDNEIDRPYHYGVRFDCGVTVDIAPADHAAMFRFSFPREGGWLVFDFPTPRGRIRLRPHARTLTAYTSVGSRRSVGARRMFIYAECDPPPRAVGRLHELPRWLPGRRGYAAFGSSTVHVRIATSLISTQQAKRNLELEISASDSFTDVRDRARDMWQELLGAVAIAGASEDQLVTFYSNLYRLFLYPNSAHENTPTAARPRDRHASAVRTRWLPSTRTRTGARIGEGKSHVNHGFWDTYRTVWPAYALLCPTRCGQLIEGFVQHYREGGWIPRWSAPGYGAGMPGTGSDVAFADAYRKGVRGFDAHAAYDAAVRNATVSPPRRRVGRKGLRESIFLGYTPTSTRQGLSWALEGCINDFGIATMARALYDAGAEDDPRRQRYWDEAEYFRHRAAGYVHHFDHRIGFFQGRTPDGEWRLTPEQYDATVWGYDYTETNGWNMAFSAPHDGNGLATLHGGPAGLENALDTFFTVPETGTRVGSYRGIIHEMIEARDVRLGQYGHANQPSHHIPYMYHHAGAPWKTQRIVGEVVNRCYVGSELGQGYPGDEDNGEMSAWYVFAALGLYPLAVGSPTYVLTAPLFRQAVLTTDTGNTVVINALRDDPDARYIRSVRVNGQPHQHSWIAHATLAAGAVLDIALTARPTSWGCAATDRPPSLTEGTDPPRPLTDLVGTVRCSDGTDTAALVDDTSRTQVTFGCPTPTVEFTVLGTPRTARMYTLTSGRRGAAPRGWVLEGTDEPDPAGDTARWVELDRRAGQAFPWPRQTRPFALSRPACYRRYRLRVTDDGARRSALAQWELLADPVCGEVGGQ